MDSIGMTAGAAVGRFAPSPTGPLHLGSLVAALGSYLFARHASGRWLLRIEDIDMPRVVPGIADDMLATLEILGFQWDGEVLYQSRRTEIYNDALQELIDKGMAYLCGCTRSEIAKIASAPVPGSDEIVYPGLCRDGIAPGKVERAYRVKVYDEVISFADGIMGRYSQVLTASCGDFVIRRADGPFAYHLAVVVDDAASGVNQVVRGSDLLTSTPRQIYLQRLLGYPLPSYAHLPLVTGPDGAKLSKRDNAVSLAANIDLRKEGGRLLLAALRFLGQEPPVFLVGAPPQEILDWGVLHFNPENIPHVSSPFPAV
ncbi:tRNA glutamyl-Q(34) synthetase GluQRS [Geotalea sp. SG265]|uniref:tRNA glutamyl-Q(34) synthetase GluQRS n=1 Tax=Geotalea sp. SG265 TaxID=2922867 RepID=UPI001FAF3734|nr:tRNA glutamyl-Q(34) synthetase GluQRS [Geotalea sp. SG265]